MVVSSQKKMPWLVDPKMFLKFGFESCDTAAPYFNLLVRKNDPDAPDPAFRDIARSGRIDDTDGVVIMYSHQCPFHEDFVEIMLEAARSKGFRAKKIRIADPESV